MIYKILLTCPPMINSLNEIKNDIQNANFEIDVPNFKQIVPENELIKILPDYDGWIIGDDPATEKVFKAGKSGKLKAAVKWGVGTDNVDFSTCKKLNIPIENTPGVFGNEVADVAIGYMLALSRHLVEIHNEVMKGEWVKKQGQSLYNKKVALIGYGDIGRNTAKRLEAFDMDITIYDPFVKNIKYKVEKWPENINRQDYIIINCPLTDSTQKLLNREIISTLKEGVYIINVARGPIIDEESLIEGLRTGIVAGAGLDVFETEPLPQQSPLKKYNCIFGSHNASNTKEAVIKTSKFAINKLNNFLQKG